MEETMAEPGEILLERNVDISDLYDVLRLSKTSIEDIVAKMLDIKKETRPESHLRELVTQVLLNFVSLRRGNRSILLEEDRVKAETERVKSPVDFTTLQLHNLMYEKNHYVKATKACKDFRTKYPDIDLVPEEEFFSDAAEEIKSAVLSTDSNHDLMLKRINYEQFQVNVHMIKMIPFNCENSVLAHQVLCLAMMFDFFLDDEHTSPEKRTCTSVIDVGLCKPL